MRTIRLSVLLASGLAWGLGWAGAENAATVGTVTVNIEAQPMESALNAFASQTGLQLLFQVEGMLTPGMKADRVVGTLPADEALKKLLDGSGLRGEFINPRTVAIRAPNDTASQNAVGGSGGLRLAQADSEAAPPVEHPKEDKPQLEEIVVTAQKREERLQDVPLSITALSGELLSRTQSYRFEDYVGKVPGLLVVDSGAVGSQLVIRGISSGSSSINSSVTTYIDETPYTAEGLFAGSNIVTPNLDTFDMQRIEVLRGPQGTLYGANALGGLLKYVTNAPDPAAFAAKVEIGGSSVEHGATGFDVHGMVNLPLTDHAALRLVGYDTYYPGFIDDPQRGVTDINGSHFSGSRLSLLYAPNTGFSIRLNVLFQQRSWGDNNNEDVNPGTLTPIAGNLIQQNLIAQPGEVKTHLYNLTLKWDTPVAKILSTTSYSDFHLDSVLDYSKQIDGVGYGNDYRMHTITQELRLASAEESRFQWQAGGYFANETAANIEPFYSIDPVSRTFIPGSAADLGVFTIPVTYRELAVFADLTYKLTANLDLSAGGRYSHNHQTFHETATGAFGGGADYGLDSSEGAFTYSSDLRWHVTRDSMLYARVASGFVPGGPNDAIATAPNFPRSYQNSTTVNYEIGLKDTLLGGRLTSELSVFHIDWRRIQLSALIDSFGTITNGGGARSDGAEWNVAYVPIKGLTLGFNGAYVNAYLTQPTPESVNGLAGDRLPTAPLWSASASAEYSYPIMSDLSGFLGVNWHFSGKRYADFSAVGPRQQMPSYHIVDFRAGVETAKWSAALFVKNATNRIAFNYLIPETPDGGFGAQSATINTPRTIGITLAAKL